MSAGGGGSNQDFELNITPIIDCFTVLITYLLLAASFVSLGMLSVTVVVDNPDMPQQENIPTVTAALNLILKEDHRLMVNLDGDKPLHITLAAVNNKVDWDGLIPLLEQIKSESGTDNVVIQPENFVVHKDIVDLVNKIKTIFSHIAFQKSQPSSSG